jgi:ATP-dependent helicase HepA
MKKSTKPNEMQVGQRWMSEMEPELGVGIIQFVERRRIGIDFPASEIHRMYSIETAPIRRVTFRVGDRVNLQNGHTFVVIEIEEKNHLLSYYDGEQYYSETEISHVLVLNTPEDKLSAGQLDYLQTYNLRLETLFVRHRFRKSAAFGFVGGCIDLLPHQLFIAHEVTNRYLPRVLLADEVGLGKTIEACLILHRLLQSGRVERVLILVPQILIFQWFVELYRRFNISFRIADEKYFKAVKKESSSANPFFESQLILSAIETIENDPLVKSQVINAGWDMIVIDEAHHLKKDSPMYPTIKQLSQQTQGMLLLSATPEQLGLENHFARLQLLDPDRYYDYNSFIDESANYQQIASLLENIEKQDNIDLAIIEKLRNIFKNMGIRHLDDILSQKNISKTRLVSQIMDTHGTGRVMFRNTRSIVKGFPKRMIHLVPLDEITDEILFTQNSMELLLDLGLSEQKPIFQLENDPRILWLVDFLKAHKDRKCLLICCYPEKVVGIQKAIEYHMNVQISVFHENIPLRQRDENAAWFADSDGAQILLCSEMGSEGRNFQFVQNLILFDLPASPDLLEQRIGRLDRIGQKKSIDIYIPFAKNSPHMELILWYHKGLDAFSKIIPYAQPVYEICKARLIETILEPSETMDEFEKLISDTKELSHQMEQALNRGRDKLLERNSFDISVAKKIKEAIITADKDSDIEPFCQKLFGFFGIALDELRHRTYRLRATHRYNEKFAGLYNKMRVTFDRKKALMLENVSFLSWDHPMISNAMELLIGEGNGQCSLAIWQDARKSCVYLESIYILECVAPKNLYMDRFIPSTPIRLIVNDQLKNCKKLFESDGFEKRLEDARYSTNLFEDAIKLVPRMIATTEQIAQKEADRIIAETLQEIEDQMDNEIMRLKTLKAMNPNVKDLEIKAAITEKQNLIEFASSARIRIDAIRLIKRGVV